MKMVTALFILLGFTLSGHPQTGFKFDFGGRSPAKGYIPVTPATLFSDGMGYGFEPGPALIAVTRRKKKSAADDYITSAQPFFFSVKLPEGNYDVKLLVGDAAGRSVTTVRAECRRLMLEHIRTANGEIKELSFTVHIRDSLIRDSSGAVQGKIRLKPREFSYLHWDNRLTLEFNDSMPRICAVEINKAPKAVTLFLAGNSTVVDQDREPWAAWGQMLPRFFMPGAVAVANYAESGETLKAFRAEQRLAKIWSMAKPGDYLFIEFAHNDQKPGANHLDPYTTYKQTLREWITEARRKQLIPILVTSMNRRVFDSSGQVINTLGDYPEAMRQAAKEENVDCIDLNAMSKTLYEAWGAAGSVKAFVHYPANSFPGQTTELKDNTHFNPYGAYELARCVVNSIAGRHLRLAKWLRKDIPAFDPAQPDPADHFYWPPCPLAGAVKPDGN